MKLKPFVLTLESEVKGVSQLGYEVSSNERQLEYLVENRKKILNRVLVRWGNSYDFYGEHRFLTTINKKDAIYINVNKPLALQKMSVVTDTPKIFTHQVPPNTWAVVRPRRHSCGNEFRVKRGPFNILDTTYATQYYKTNTEFRVWFAFDAILIAKRIGKATNQFVCRSNWDYDFSPVQFLTQFRLIKTTTRAKNIIGLDLGAADIIMVDGKPKVLELNSAPELDDPAIVSFYRTSIDNFVDSLYNV